MNKIILILILIFPSLSILAQESEKITPKLDFTYLKKSDGNKLLSASLYIFKDRRNYPLPNNKISFGIGTQHYDIITNKNGLAYLIIEKNNKLPIDGDGFTKYIADFVGHDSLESISQEIIAKEAFINLSLDIIDSIRTVTAHVYDLSATGDSIPVSGITLNLYVPRMFSLLKIGEETTDDSGLISFEFPKDLPGSADSTITVIARIDESEKYGNVEVKKTAHWGIPIIHRIPESHRALWTEIAPVWMIVTLSVMLVGVWGHYIFVIIQLILIKIESKKQKT
jgi:hypothetical protein